MSFASGYGFLVPSLAHNWQRENIVVIINFVANVGNKVQMITFPNFNGRTLETNIWNEKDFPIVNSGYNQLKTQQSVS